MCYNEITKDEARASEGKGVEMMDELMTRLIEERLRVAVEMKKKELLKQIMEKMERSKEQETQEELTLRYDKENNVLTIPENFLVFLKNHEDVLEELKKIIKSLGD